MPNLARMERDLARDLGRCIRDYELISAGDRVMVCVSGGKDSYVMLHLLERARRRSPVPFELVAVHLDQGHPGYDGTGLEGWLEAQGYSYRIIREDTYSIVTEHIPEGKTYCSMCSRLRRGILYNVAEELGCNRIALGHHRDDAIETLLLNMMFAGSLGSMPPKLVSKDGRNVVIRPLLYASESKIAEFASLMEFPILPCDLCGSQDGLQRQQVKKLIGELEERIPRLRGSLFGALSHVRASHLMDRDLWKSVGLHQEAAGESVRAEGEVEAEPEASPLMRPDKRLNVLS